MGRNTTISAPADVCGLKFVPARIGRLLEIFTFGKSGLGYCCCKEAAAAGSRPSCDARSTPLMAKSLNKSNVTRETIGMRYSRIKKNFKKPPPRGGGGVCEYILI